MRPSAMVAVALIAALTGLVPAAAAPGDTVADHVFGQGGSFTSNACNNGGISAASLCNPVGVAADTAGHLYIADSSSNRVLEYDSPLITDTVADRIFGQGGNFTTSTCNKGGISASSLCNPLGIAVDTAGRLYVADYDNNRVLEYDSPLTSQVASRVFGQPDFVSSVCNNGGISASSLCSPEGVRADSAGHLYIADKLNHRALEYDSPLTSQAANRVFGQPDFVSNSPNNGGVSASSLAYPEDVAIDAAGNAYISDYFNNRILEYNTPLTTDTVADRVFGQGGSFTTRDCNNGGISASSLCTSSGVALDSAGRLYSSDGATNNRALAYNSPLTSQTANRVFGQGGSFTSNACNNGGVTAGSLCNPNKIAVDSSGNFYVADNNNRVLEYDGPYLVGGMMERPDVVEMPARQSASSGPPHAALAVAAAAGAVTLAAGVWCTRRLVAQVNARGGRRSK